MAEGILIAVTCVVAVAFIFAVLTAENPNHNRRG